MIWLHSRKIFDPSCQHITYIFADARVSDMYQLPNRLGNNTLARVLISFVSLQHWHLAKVLYWGSNIPAKTIMKGLLKSPRINHNRCILIPHPSRHTRLMIYLYPIQIPGPSDSDHLSSQPYSEIRNEIVIQFTSRGTVTEHASGHYFRWHRIAWWSWSWLEDTRYRHLGYLLNKLNTMGSIGYLETPVRLSPLLRK